MKKNSVARSLLFAMVMSAAQLVLSQDTLIGPKCNYYFRYWHGGNYMPYDTLPVSPEVFYTSPFLHGTVTKLFHTDTIIEIHGIAAGLYSECEPHNEPVIHPIIPEVDSSNVADLGTENVFEYLRLYVPDKDGDSMILINEGRVHYTEDPFDHYLLLGHRGPAWHYPRHQKVYEVYFDTASRVVGDFCIGISQINSIYDTAQGMWNTWPIGLVEFFSNEWLDIFFDTLYIEYEGDRRWPYAFFSGHLYIFPILDHDCHIPPTEDTTNHSAIRTPADLGTVLQPNPATESVRVVSAFGMTRVEAYNNAGVKVLEQRTEGSTATLNVSRWPSGNYVLLIYTPQGVARKPLVVSR